MPLTLSPPACRMVYVCGFTLHRENGAEGPDVEVMPVVSLVSDGRGRPKALVVDFDFGLITTDELEEFAADTAGELVACPWPPEEDEARLAPAVRRVLASVGKKSPPRLAVAASTA